MSDAPPEPVSMVVTPARRVGAVAAALMPNLAMGAGLVVVGRFGRALFWLVLGTVALAASLYSTVGGLLAAAAVFIGSLVDAATAKPPETGIPSTRRFVMVFIGFALLGLAMRGWVTGSVVRPFAALTRSMEPNLLEGERFMGDVRRRPVDRGAIYAFDGQQLAARPTDSVHRVVAVAGETIALKPGGILEVDGRALSSDAGVCGSLPKEACFARHEQHGDRQVTVEYRHAERPGCAEATFGASGCPAGMEPQPNGCRVPAGHVFVLGDNRCSADDSRRYGAVPESALLGRALEVYFSRGPGGLRRERLGAGLN